MPLLPTAIDATSASFAANRADMERLVDELGANAAAAALGGGEAARARHTGRGKLLPRTRIERLLDPGSPFLEIGQLAALGMYDGEAPSAGVIAGIGRVTGREVMIKTIAAFTVVSASSNIVPLIGGVAGTAILAATAGKWATLVSDGTNWIVMAAA